jgi:ribosomal protein S18 acetylase RimI-like enzyme
MIGQAFSDKTVNFMYPYLMQDSTDVAADLGWFVWARLAVNRDMGGYSMGLFDRDGQILSSLSIGTIQSQSPTLWMKVKHGLVLFPVYFGFGVLQRLDALGEETTRVSREYNGDCDVEVMMVATRVGEQGKGFGQRLMRDALQQLPCSVKTIGLGTQLQKNVKFYEKFGFEITGEHQYASCGGKTGWTMKLVREG